MATKDEVQSFLQDFKAKLEIWGVVFRDDRGKNAQALLTLDITPIFREKILKELEVLDYSAGPVTDTLNRSSDLWIFGKRIGSYDVYIKITLGLGGKSVICISFHVAEQTMNYPLK